MAAAPQRTSADPADSARPTAAQADDTLRRDLLARMATGDRPALAALYTLEHRPVLSYLHTITADPGLAEELLQDTFLAA